MILNVFKPLGKTSLEMINILREKYPEYSNQKISFAGRLDPMAQGVLILLVGDDENSQRREREKSDKEYDFTMIFGISSDTYDICGLPQLSNKETNEKEVKSKLKMFEGKILQKIPKYSAYMVRGKPMYVRAANGTLLEKEIPKIEREVYSLKADSFYTMNGQELLKEIETRIGEITKDDFRQEKIVPQYKKMLDKSQTYLLNK